MARSAPLTENLFGRALLLLVLSALVAVLANTFSPVRIPWVQPWGDAVERAAAEEGVRVVVTSEVQAFLNEGRHLFFDARPLADYDQGHIPSAMSFPSESMAEEFEMYAALLTPDQPITVYCSGTSCDESLLLAQFLISHGVTNVALFAGGFTAWTDAGGEVE